MRTRYKVLSAGVLAAGLWAAATMGASAGTHVNGALSITGANTHNSVHTAFQTNTNVGTSATDVNRASATSVVCQNCHTVAVAVQIDLASGPVVAIHADNKAVAYENRTVNADTCASAYQFVIAPSVQTSFSADGSAAIGAIKASVQSAANSGASCESIQASVANDMDSLLNTLLDSSTYNGVAPTAAAAARSAAPAVNVSRYVDVKSA